MASTFKIQKPPKLKELNQQNIIDILYLLQPVFYTNNQHQVDFYSEGFGSVLKAKQQAYIDAVKQNITQCNTKKEIQRLFDYLDADIAYFPGFVREDLKRKGQKEFWASDFGKGLLEEWRWMLNRFVSHINKMVEIM